MEVSKLNSQSYSPENTITAQSALTLLAEASKYGIVDIEGVLKEIIEQHPYAITQGANGRWYTYVADPNAKHGRRQIAKSTKQKVLDAIISDYHQHHNEDDVKEITLEELYKRLKPALLTKKNELKRSGIEYIKEEDIWNYLTEVKWANSKN